MRNRSLIFVSILFLVLLVGCENVDKSESREVSPTFSLLDASGDRLYGQFLLIGKKDKVGFIVGSVQDGKAVEQPIIANKVNKYMWHFWGKEEAISGDFKVVGIDEKGKVHPVLVAGDDQVWEYSNTVISPLNGADSHTPSNMMFPTSGLWTLKVYFNEKLFDEIVINVEDGV